MVHAIQVQRNPKPSIPRPIRPPQDRRIVPANLGMARPVRRRAVKLVENKALDRVNSVINPRRHDKHAKHVLVRRRQPQLRTRPVDLRAHVHGRARLVRRHELGVEPHGGAARGDEHVLGDGGHGGDGGGVLHAGGVAVRAEDLEAGVAGGAEGLEPLVGLLAVVEGRGHAVDADVGVGDELEGGPLACLLGPVGLDVAVDWGLLVGEVWDGGDARRGEGERGRGGMEGHRGASRGSPSRILKPTLAQSMASVGGGGNDMAAVLLSAQVRLVSGTEVAQGMERGKEGRCGRYKTRARGGGAGKV